MKLISAFIFVLGVYFASVSGDELVKSAGNGGSEAPSPVVNNGKAPVITSPNGDKPEETAIVPGAEKSPATVRASVDSNHSVVLDSEKSPVTVHASSASNHSAPEVKPLESSSVSRPIPVTTTTDIPVTPQPLPERFSWNVTEGNTTCILLTGKLELEVTGNKSTNSVPFTHLTKAVGSCKKSYITFFLESVTTLTITFQKNDSSKDYFVHQISGFYLNSTQFNNETLKLYVTPLNNSYSCTPKDNVFISTDKSKNNTFSLKVSDLKIQAFKTSKGSDFDSGIDCESSPAHTPDIVPIIVGCALALLVVAVLAAYLISRRQSQARGYLSM